ncbi:MAG TPA: hypothetical protein VFW93_16490 [Aquabacterium sp.]|uniref:hypothetical protein n=1 Tax=Aquabacterium sp. TaxID=1872578 RepID=UPI002E2F0DD4|nr:hypothetical protein [Aquabacterium sp.]HEX5357804.1 hypothetical protein [Aquabacterium sp.]
MIFVKRNPALIPRLLLDAAAQAQRELDQIAEPDARKAYIEKRARLWRRFARYLKQMSYGKCWYSESDCVQSFADVDHFRPKKAAKRSEGETDDGYPWLAFSWENFRYAAQRSNQLNTDEDLEETVGKGAWFPLMPGSKKACWDDRCDADERPVILDPASKADVKLVAIDGAGVLVPSGLCLGEYERWRVTESVRYLGLNLDGLVGARKRAMDSIQEQVQQVFRATNAADVAPDKGQQIAQLLPISQQLDSIQKKTLPSNPYAAAIRAQLSLMGLGQLCLRAEEIE